MAINLAGLLSGFGAGLTQRRETEEANRKLKLQEDKFEQASAQDVLAQIQSLAKEDEADEQQTLDRLRSPTLDKIAKQQDMDARRLRHDNNQKMIAQLATIPGITKYFGDVRGVLQPSRIAGAGFQMPAPEMDPVRVGSEVEQWRKRAEAAPDAEKAGVIGLGRRALAALAPQDYIDQVLPNVGTVIGRIPSAQAPTALQNPEQFFAQNKEFTQGVGGERALPGRPGVFQKVSYQNGTPMVSYEKNLVADYVTPEAQLLRNDKMRADTERVTRLLDPQVRLAWGQVEKLKWENMYNKVRALKAHDIIGAQIAKASGAGQSAQNNLRLLALQLSHQRGMMALGMRQSAMDRQSMMDERTLRDNINRDIITYQKELSDAQARWGKAKSEGRSAEQVAARQAIAMYQSELSRLRSQYAGLKSSNTGVVQSTIDSIVNSTEDSLAVSPMLGGMAGGGMMGGYGGGGMMAAPAAPVVNYFVGAPGMGQGGPQPGQQAGTPVPQINPALQRLITAFNLPVSFFDNK